MIMLLTIKNLTTKASHLGFEFQVYKNFKNAKTLFIHKKIHNCQNHIYVQHGLRKT